MLNYFKLAVVGGLALACIFPQLASAATLSWEDVQINNLPVQPVDDNTALAFTLTLPSYITPAKLRDKDQGTMRVGNAILDPANANKLYFSVFIGYHTEDGKAVSTNKVYAFDRRINKLQRIYREYTVGQDEVVLGLDFIFGNKLVINYQVGDNSPNPCDEVNYYSRGASYLDTLRPWSGMKKFTYPKSIIERNAQEMAAMCKNI